MWCQGEFTLKKIITTNKFSNRNGSKNKNRELYRALKLEAKNSVFDAKNSHICNSDLEKNAFDTLSS